MRYIFLLLLVACNPLRHYQEVATDINVTEAKKAVIAPWVHLNFPVIPTFIQGRTDTIIEVQELPGDTTTFYQHDTTTVTIRGTDRVVTKYIRQTDTLRIEGTAVSDALRRQLATCGAESVAKDIKITELNAKVKEWYQDKWFWIAMGAIISLAGSLYLNFKR